MNKKSSEIRSSFLNFFAEKGCKKAPSDSLVPTGDKTLLFTSAGMVQFKQHFLGQSKDTFTKATTSQKCFRTSDIDQVGITNRHLTFFEMLGNFSFGDYFKEEAIAWAWDFLTNVIRLPKDKLYITIYKDDGEAGEIWKKIIPSSRIIKMGDETNFWNMGHTGPCGPCSEILIDLGEDMSCGKPDCGPQCDCNRYLEIWNLVFTQFDRQENGELKPLPRKNIDTGMGLERLVAVANGKNNVFETDLFIPIMEAASDILKVKINDNVSKLRMIADHARAITFLISDGILPSNEGRGYVLRRILRRALRQGKMFGTNEPFLYKLTDSVYNIMKPAYPELSSKLDNIKSIVLVEEKKFLETLHTGTEILSGLISDYKNKNIKILKGSDVFKLYDTYGFPQELTKEIAHENGLNTDEEGFLQEKKKAQDKSRNAWSGSGEKDITFYSVLYKDAGDTLFKGYTDTASDAKIVSIIKNGKKVNSLSQGDNAEIILDQTPFYAESGGQVADKGCMSNDNSEIEVSNVLKPIGNLFVHYINVKKGTVKAGDKIIAKIDINNRKQITRHHTATHILQKVLRDLLGTHVAQAGSLVTPDYLRFDFNHFKPVSKEELLQIETQVNSTIRDNLPLDIADMPVDQARQSGAMALFGEKYGDIVRTVSIKDKEKTFSMELCGGTHIERTGDIGMFKIISESSVGSGIRRIEAVAGKTAEKYFNSMSEQFDNLSKILKVSKNNIETAVEKLLSDLKKANNDISVLKSKSVSDEINEYIKKAQTVNNINVLAFNISDTDIKSLRDISDKIKEKLKSCITVITTSSSDKASFIVSVTDDIVNKGFNAGKIAKAISAKIGGSGGGKPDFAQGGCKDISKIQSVIDNITEIING